MSVQPSKKPRIFDDITNITYIPQKQLIRQIKAPHSTKSKPINKLHQALIEPKQQTLKYSNTEDVSPIKQLKDYDPSQKKAQENNSFSQKPSQIQTKTFEEDTLQYLEQHKNKLQQRLVERDSQINSHYLVFDQEQFNKFHDHAIHKMNNLATQSQNQINQIQQNMINKDKNLGIINDYANQIEKKLKQTKQRCQSTLEDYNEQVNKKIDTQEFQQQLYCNAVSILNYLLEQKEILSQALQLDQVVGLFNEKSKKNYSKVQELQNKQNCELKSLQTTFKMRLDQLDKKLLVNGRNNETASNLQLMNDMTVDQQSFEQIQQELSDLDMKADEIGLQLNIKMDADNELERYKKEYFDFQQKLQNFMSKS